MKRALVGGCKIDFALKPTDFHQMGFMKDIKMLPNVTQPSVLWSRTIPNGYDIK